MTAGDPSLCNMRKVVVGHALWHPGTRKLTTRCTPSNCNLLQLHPPVFKENHWARMKPRSPESTVTIAIIQGAIRGWAMLKRFEKKTRGTYTGIHECALGTPDSKDQKRTQVALWVTYLFTACSSEQNLTLGPAHAETEGWARASHPFSSSNKS